MTAVLQSPSLERAARFELLVRELQSILHVMDPHLSDEAVLQEAVHHAAFRLSGGTLLGSFIA